ncbi:hypothetical protein P280DRAFT_455978 [Massarina eburnea CBS 473.64]|uniref:Uncharacterized protein n=1 Tax=Massarina eburnea CBS 473.64 TaxID=1395130 RepID=A0A6A6RTY6_9PLEO|nr:hypothetical protein P280DRAFT_455978 [Massarina eburnea CBS 473.64]
MALEELLHPVQRSLAPWATKSECYWMIVNLRSLPEGVYDSLEEPCLEHADFKGGLGLIIIVRYKETPVGPYDEIILIPGSFAVPQPKDGPIKIPKNALRVCRIYVSQRTTTYNGRLNWNIPKHLARFWFSAPVTEAGQSPPAKLEMAAYPPGTEDGDGVSPFFACTIRPFRWVPSIPFNFKWLPFDTRQVQPPLPQAGGQAQAVKSELQSRKEGNGTVSDYNTDPKHEEALMAGTDMWRTFPIHASAPRVRGCRVTVHKNTNDTGKGESPNKYWPQDVRPFSIAMWLEDAEMSITIPVEWKL